MSHRCTGADSAALAPAQEAQTPASADLVQVVTKIDRAIKERRDSDTPLINYWLYLLLVSWVTLGIYVLVLFFKRISRIDRFSERKRPYYEALIDWSERYSKRQAKEDEVHHMLRDMRSEIQAAYKGNLRKINAGLSFLLTIITFGIYGLYVLYRMNRYWWDAQVIEQEFDDKLSQVWSKLGLMRYPVSFTLDQAKRRSYLLYLILSIVTIGIWAIVWDYKIHTDPDNLYREFHSNRGHRPTDRPRVVIAAAERPHRSPTEPRYGVYREPYQVLEPVEELSEAIVLGDHILKSGARQFMQTVRGRGHSSRAGSETLQAAGRV